MSKELVERQRNSLGRFVKGISGNPAGRPAGVRNQTTQIKEFIEHAGTEMLAEEAPAIMAKAIQLAKGGDQQMIKLLVGDMLESVRGEEGQKADNSVSVTISLMQDDAGGITIENPPQPEESS